MRANLWYCLLAPFLLFSPEVAAPALTQQPLSVAEPESAAEQQARINRVLDLEKKNEEANDLYERLERVEIRKNSGDAQPLTVKISRVVPAGTGVDHIPVGADGK